MKALKQSFGLPQDRRLSAARGINDQPAVREARRLIMKALHMRLIKGLRTEATTQAITLSVFCHRPNHPAQELETRIRGHLHAEGKRLDLRQEKALGELIGRLKGNYEHLLALDVLGDNATRFIDTLFRHWIKTGEIKSPQLLAGNSVELDMRVTPFALVLGFPTELYFNLFGGIAITGRGEEFGVGMTHGRTFAPQINGRQVPIIVAPKDERDLNVWHEFTDEAGRKTERTLVIRVNPVEVLAHEMEHAKTQATGIRLSNSRRTEAPKMQPRLKDRARLLYRENMSRSLKHELSARLHDTRSVTEALRAVNEAVELEFEAYKEPNQHFLSEAEIRQIRALPQVLAGALAREKPYVLIELMRNRGMDIWQITRRLRSLANPR